MMLGDGSIYTGDGSYYAQNIDDNGYQYDDRRADGTHFGVVPALSISF